MSRAFIFLGWLGGLAFLLCPLSGLVAAQTKDTPEGKAKVSALPRDPNANPTLQPLDPGTRAQLSAKGDDYGRNGDWQKAYECFQQVVASGKHTHQEWSWAAAAALAAGATNACEKYCDAMMAAFGKGTNADLAERCAKYVLSLPKASEGLLQKAVERATFAIGKDRKNPWRRLVKGMAEYRTGDWAGALELLSPLEASPELEISLPASCFAAMARDQSGDKPGALQALARADSKIWVLNYTGELGDQRYHRWYNIACHMAVRGEAEQLVNGRPLPNPLHAEAIPANREKWQEVTWFLTAAEDSARKSVWAAASQYMTQAMQHPQFNWRVFEAKDSNLAEEIAAVFLMADEQGSYQDLVGALLKRPIETLPLSSQARYGTIFLAKPGLLTPEMRKSGLALARRVSDVSEAATDPWLMMLRGITDYREGHFAEAVETLQQGHFRAGDSVAQAWATTFQAMALKRLGRTKEAMQATEQANSLFAQPTRSTAPWVYRTYYQLAMKELLGLLSQGDTDQTKSPK